MKKVTQDIFSKQILIIQKKYLICIRIYHFYQKKKVNKCEKLICSIEDKEKYVISIRALKQALNHGLILKKVHRVIKFNQRAWLKKYIDNKIHWYDQVQPKYGDRAKLCYTDTNSFIIHIITADFYKDIADDVKIWFDTSYYDENDKRPLPIGENKKELDFFKDELGRKDYSRNLCVQIKNMSIQNG